MEYSWTKNLIDGIAGQPAWEVEDLRLTLRFPPSCIYDGAMNLNLIVL